MQKCCLKTNKEENMDRAFLGAYFGEDFFMAKFISFVYMVMIVMEFVRQAENGALLLLKLND
ncbi:hypothetical protein H839_07954 [Parageobacillus genomosp. 1]|uniref:Uncharacterized protein n=1 Tax=Parageobacillus genomosp. 1 TaxID=1295642 RepID=A0ABC9VG43_9BACL|nr:hypothetical protein H839_07954 [Parageobacillus genomosp. 1]